MNQDSNQKIKEGKEESIFFFLKKVSLVDRYNFYEYLGVLLDGGVNVAEAIKTSAEKISNAYFKHKIENDLFTFVSSGDTISKSMKKLPMVFDSSEVAIIEAGESTGNVSNALMNLSEELKKQYALTQKVKGALTYPIIIFFFLLVAVVIVLIYVIPAIRPLFDESGVTLPVATQALIFTSDMIRYNFLTIILVLFALFVMLVGYKSTEKGKANYDYFLLSIPIVGKVYKNYILAGIASNIGNLIGSGVNVIKALTLVGRGTNNKVYETMMNAIIEKVMKGEKITDAMKDVDPNHHFFPGDYVQMFAVGEKTASIESLAGKVHNQYTREVEYSLANLTKWIEPLAILIAGVFVLWFAFAIFGAILKVTQTVS